ncbi:hypothetical protein NC652_015532 [Populus alba x Populus x berolinensis]|nr:hypothetical protein NC652_015532 [Populus alba x Populus x berolinensis]
MIYEERDALILSASAAATNIPVMAKYRFLMKGTAENQDLFWASSIYFVAKVGSHACKMAVCENEKVYYRPGIIAG